MSQFNDQPLWGFSASYLVPSGQRSYLSGVVRCAAADVHGAVLDMIKRNPRRRYLGKLDVYSSRLIEEKGAAI